MFFYSDTSHNFQWQLRLFYPAGLSEIIVKTSKIWRIQAKIVNKLNFKEYLNFHVHWLTITMILNRK